MIAGLSFVGSALVALQISIVIGSLATPTINDRWVVRFNENDTEIDTFTLLNGALLEVHMMKSSIWRPYIHVQHLQADVVTVMFATTTMIVIIPHPGIALNIVEEKLKEMDLSNISGQGSWAHLSLPKFKLDTAFECPYQSENQNISNVGMFDYDTKRSPDHEISQQKAFLDVNEYGANTSLPFTDLGPETKTNGDSQEIRVDHPFIVIIHERLNINNIILQARIVDPTSSSYILKTTGTAPTIKTTTSANTEIFTGESDNGNEIPTIDSLTSTSEPQIPATVLPSTISIPTEIAPTVEPGQKIFIQSDESGSLNPNQINNWIFYRIGNMKKIESESGSSRLLAELNFKQDSNFNGTKSDRVKFSSQKTEIKWKFYY